MSQAKSSTVDPRTAANWLSDGKAIMIDVREPDEFRGEHIPFAASIPAASVARIAASLPADRKVIFQCLSGARAAQVCDSVGQAFSERAVFNLEGGIKGWKDAGLPTIGTSSGGSFPSLFRQVQIAVGFLMLLLLAIGWFAYAVGIAAAAAVSAMLAIAGLTGWCGMALLLARMPWNRAS